MDENKKKYELSGPEKTGAFIKLLRVSHNLTQEELGDMVDVTRKSVSKWENGICYPSIDLIPRLADLFGVSLEEILAGEFNCEFDEKTAIDYVIRVFKNKRIKTTIRCIFALLVFCLIIFFFENYNATKIYDVFFEDGSIYLKNSVIISTRSKQYFNFGSIWIDDPKYSQTRPINIQLYTKNKNDNKKVIAEYSTKNNSYYRNSNYKELSVSDINELINSVWAVVKYNDSDNKVVEKNIPLQIELRYKSNDVVQLKDYKSNVKTKVLTLERSTDNQNYNRLNNIIDISNICALTEREKVLVFNKKKKGTSYEYKNEILKILNAQMKLTINFRDNTFVLANLLSRDKIVANGTISNCSLIVKNCSLTNQTGKEIYQIQELLSEN